MKLIRYEIQKTVLSKGFRGMCLILLAVSACLGVFFADALQYDTDAVEKIMDDYEQDPASVIKKYTELQKAYGEYTELLYSDIDMNIRVPEFATEFEQYRIAFERINRQHTYIEKLDNAIKELAKQQSSMSGEQNIINDYLGNTYERNKSLRLGREDMSGLEGLFGLLSYLWLPIVTAGAFLGSTVAFCDRRRGSELLIHSAVYGRRSTSAAKTVACAVCSGVLSASAVFLSIGIYSVLSGFYAFCEYIQNNDAFSLFPVPVTVLQVILLIFVFHTLSCFLVCMVACLAGKYSKNRSFPLVCTSAVILIQYLFGFVNPHVAGSVLRIGSLASLCDGNKLFSHIYAVVMGGKAVYGMAAVSAVYLLCAVAVCIGFVFPRHRTAGHKPIALPILRIGRRQKRIKTVSAYEWQKQLIANKTLLLFAAAMMIKIYVSLALFAFQPTYTEQKYQSYMTSIEGTYTAEKYENWKGELSACRDVLEKKEETERKYRAGEITRAEMGKFLAAYYEAEQNEKALVKAGERLESIRSQIEDGKKPSIVYDTGWNVLLAQRADAVLLIFIIAAMCGIYGDEYKHGMHRLYAVCNKKALHRSKIVFCVGLSFICVALFRAVDTIIIAREYSLPLMTAQASSIEGTSVLNSLPLFVYTLVQFAANCIAVCAFALMVFAVSYCTKNKIMTFVLSFAILFGAAVLI